MPSYSGSFAWEIVSAIQSMNADKQEKYEGYLDDIFGEGATDEALQINTYSKQNSSINDMFENTPINRDTISEPGNSSKLTDKYIDLALDEPVTFIKMKWEMISHTLGLNKPINQREYDYNRWELMDEYDYNNSAARRFYVSYFNGIMGFLVLLRRPWIMFLLCLILILIWRFKYKGKKSEINLYEAAYIMSVFYYGAYVLKA